MLALGRICKAPLGVYHLEFKVLLRIRWYSNSKVMVGVWVWVFVSLPYLSL